MYKIIYFAVSASQKDTDTDTEILHTHGRSSDQPHNQHTGNGNSAMMKDSQQTVWLNVASWANSPVTRSSSADRDRNHWPPKPFIPEVHLHARD